MLFQLFQIGECYEINELIISCCYKLCQYLSVENVCIFLIYLEKYDHVQQIRDIINLMLDFLVQNIKIIKKSKGYQSLIKYKPSLLNKLIDKIIR